MSASSPHISLDRRVVDITDDQKTGEYADSVDFVLSTIPTAFDMKPYLSLIKHDGALLTVGMLEPIPAEGIDFAAVSVKRLTLAGSFIGSIAETQEVLDFRAEHDISAEVKVIPADDINSAFDNIVAGDIEFRYVIDNSTLPRP